MLVWSGYGIMVAFFLLLGWFGTITLISHLQGDPDYWLKNAWVEPLGMIISGTMIFLFSLLLKEEKRVLIDVETEEEVILEKKHDFIWIPVKYWPYACMALAVLFYWQRS